MGNGMAEQTPHQHDGLWDFLRKRGVAEQNINQMQQDKIDTSLIREIEDAYLARYIPVYGDRIATRRYCLDKQKREEDNSSKMSLLEKLRKRMRTSTASHKVFISIPVAVSSESHLDDTLPVFSSTEEVTSVALTASTPVLGDCVDHAFYLSGNEHYDPLSEIQQDDTVSVFNSTEEVISVAPFTSTPVSEGHVEHTEHSSFDAGYELVTVSIKLLRVNLVEEMICQFKDELILNYPLKYSFINEKGTDADGVARDVYAAFWTEFLDCAAEGAEMRVPCLSPKWQEEEWKAVGRILAKGFLDQGYFPLRLAPAFTTALIFGEHAVSPDLLFESLLLYLSQCERDLIATALQEDIDSDGQDELLDLLDRLGVKMVPSRDKLKAVLLQVAHKQIIQQPKYALDNMSAVAGQLLRTTITTTAKIQVMYENKKPTCRKVLKMIEASPVTPAEKQAFRFLQQYIRQLDEPGLKRMLRFVTGSDIICVTQIEVIFTALEGLARRPVAHTCGSVLELPCTYNSYPELRVEMDNVLTSNYYTMDIV
ncbi:hypothetical protein PFLUV_G00102540 [Perca fluviatilis]|uniref:HECT domain-containing protein n=2 Tax=Perca fluviatilis TaxID=8168 RepID=A0A6A5ED08_PERFL|nr:hypothetical protein PFLUV_G00102540 [Perca fluviatilis]